MNEKALEYFRLIAKEFAEIDDETVQKWMGIVSFYVDLDKYPEDKAQYIIALYAAHLLTLTQRANSSSGYAGTVAREKEGDLERTYISYGFSKDSLITTNYGLQLEGLLNVNSACIMTRHPYGGPC